VKVRDLFEQAVALPTEQRSAFLDAACANDVTLRAEVETLLAFDARFAADGDTSLGPLGCVLDRSKDPPSGGGWESSRERGALSTHAAVTSKLGHFRLLRPIASGGMGAVYEAEQDNPRRSVALKIVRPGLASPALVKRFTHEAQILARLHHPGIAQVYEAGLADDGQPFFAMEFIRGLPLDEYADRHGLDLAARLGLVARVCDAVQHAHDRGVIHRDLKPANILVEEGEQPKVLDFGVARATAADLLTAAGLTRTGHLLGTPNYMSPEQLAANPAAIDRRADVYALGVILFELAAHRLPYRLEDRPLAEAARLILEQDPPRLGSINPELRGDVETIVAKALEKEPARRYPSAAELAADLRRWLSHEPILARRVSAAERFGRWCQRNPVVAGLLAAVFLLLAAVAGVASVGYLQTKRGLNAARAAEATAKGEASRARTAEQEMRRQWYAATSNLMQPAWDTGQIGRLRTLLVETEAYPDRGFEWYYWQRLCHLHQHTLIGHPSRVVSVSWSPEGTRLATASMDGTAKVWDAAGGRELRTLKGHTGWLWSVSWSPDGTRLATGSADGTAKVWEAADGRDLLTLRGHTGWVYAASWSPDGTRLATGSDDGTAKVWEAADGRELLTLRGHAGTVFAVSWSRDGRRLATGNDDGTAKVWDAAGGREVRTLKGHTGWVLAVSWSPDGTRLATGSTDGTAKVCEAAGGQDLLTLTGHTGPVWSVSWSRDGTRLATGSEDGTAKVWDAAGGRALRTLKGHTGWVRSVSWSSDGTRLATASNDGTAKVWDAAGGREGITVEGHRGVVRSVSWSPDGTRLATGGGDSTAQVWDPAGGRALLTFEGHTRLVLSVSWSPDGTRLATGSADGTAKVWEAADGRELRTLAGHAGPVGAASWSPDGTRLATGSGDGTTKVWEPAGGRELLALRGHEGTVYAVSWSPDGRQLATGSYDGTAKVWDAAGGRALRTLRGHLGKVYDVSWSRDGTRLATGSTDGTAKVWDAAGGRELLTLKGHTGWVRSVSWSSDGTRLATGSEDGTAKVWDAASGRELLTLKGHARWVWSVSWSPDGTRLATGSEDGTAKVWDAAGAAAVQRWARQDRAVQELLDSNDFRNPHAQGFLQTWLLLLPLPLAAGESAAKALDRQQLPDEAQLRPRPGEGVAIGGERWVWQEHRSPRAVVNFNAAARREADRSVVYAACYIESDRARDGLWLQVGSDDQGKVYLNGREIYQCRQTRDISWLDPVGPVGLKRGVNVLLFKVVNESGPWEGCARLVDDAGRPVQGLRVKLTP
jgi:WD40 repeat protein/predicted Ser/Thr protein kinase